jgi:hypothetical protein
VDLGRSYWDWVRHVPPGWSVPDELMSPTSVPSINLLIRMLESELVGNDIIEAIGQVISEIARFNMWYARSVDGKVAPERQARLYEKYRDITKTMFDSWRRYCDASTTAPPESDNEDEPEYRDLLATLRAVASELVDARKQNE